MDTLAEAGQGWRVGVVPRRAQQAHYIRPHPPPPEAPMDQYVGCQWLLPAPGTRLGRRRHRRPATPSVHLGAKLVITVRFDAERYLALVERYHPIWCRRSLLLMASPSSTPEDLAALRSYLGLDQPLPERTGVSSATLRRATWVAQCALAGRRLDSSRSVRRKG